MTIWAIVPAAGIGQRMATEIPKQYLELAGKPVILRSLEKLLAVPALESIVVTLHAEDNYFHSLNMPDDRIETTTGGSERQQSVLNGLLYLEGRARDEDWVLVHDAVRPCVQTKDIEQLLGQLAQHKVGGLLATPQDNTLKRADELNEVVATESREQLWQALTPQMFPYALLKQALLNAQEHDLPVTDEASAVEALGPKPLLVEGDRNNIKITRAADLRLAELILQAEETSQ